MKNDFLNKKEHPSYRDILTLFFSKSEIDEIEQNLERTNATKKDILQLGEPDEIETVQGTEWELSRAKWNTEDGPRYLIFTKKTSQDFDVIDDFLRKLETNVNLSDPEFNKLLDKNFMEQNPMSPFGKSFEDIDFDEVIEEPLTFEQQLELAVENENFEEAARLRDWNKELVDLLLKLKPRLIKAIEDGDLDSLDKCQKLISQHRAKL